MEAVGTINRYTDRHGGRSIKIYVPRSVQGLLGRRPTLIYGGEGYGTSHYHGKIYVPKTGIWRHAGCGLDPLLGPGPLPEA